MASIIRIKRSAVSGNPSTLAAGELAYSSLQDTGSNGGDRLYIGMGTEINENAANHIVIGGKYYTGLVDAGGLGGALNTTAKSIPVLSDTGTIDKWLVGTLQISSNSIESTTTNSDINILPNGTGRTVVRNLYIGDQAATLQEYIYDLVGGTITAGTGITRTVDDAANTTTISISNTAVTAGTYGSATAIPTFTVNAQGQLTAASTVNIATSLSIAGGTGTDTVSLLSDTLTFTGGTGVTTAVTNNAVTFSIGQAVNTTSNVTFNDVTVNGKLYSNDITATSVNVDGDAVITGNLTVQGTTTTVNSVTVSIADKNIEISKDATTAAQADGAGITVTGPTTAATITYSSIDDRWNLNKDLNVGTVYGALSGNASTATKWATARNLSLTGDATATLSSVDGSAAVSAALTLATVNSNVGSFGSGTSVPTVTVNAKGLVTAVTTTAIPTASTSTQGLANFSSTNFAVTAGTVTITQVDGGTY